MPNASPLIVTALLGSRDFAWADALRRAHFPPERNFLSAHITLFHHLPPARLGELETMLRGYRTLPKPRARLAGLMFLGRGVAYRVDSPDLLHIRSEIAEHFERDLIPQDRHTPRLHITVQNKVDPASAKALHARLETDFVARPIEISGLAIWHYLGGPWRLERSVHFLG